MIYANPSHRVFVDCRSDLYGTEFIQSYLTVLEARTGWEEILGKYDVTVVLVPQRSAIQAALMGSERWRLYYQDQTAGMFIRRRD